MNNICIFAGEEDYLKDMQVFKLCSRYRNSNKKTFYIESYRSDNLSEEFREIETFLSTYDFFSSFKIVKIILFKPEQVQYILNNIKGLSDESLLIIDIKCPEYLLKNTEFKYCGEKINIEVFREFKDYEKDKVFKNIRNAFIMEGIVFESKEDEEHALEYLFNTAQNSYSFIYKEIKKLKLLGKSPVSLNDLLNITTVFSNKNFYRACSKIFESSNDGELVEVLENYLPETSVKTLSAFINIFTSKINDYILLSKGLKCRQKSNYFLLKDTKLKIDNPEKFIVNLNKLALSMKKDKNILKEELIWCMIEHIRVVDNVF